MADFTIPPASKDISKEDDTGKDMFQSEIPQEILNKAKEKITPEMLTSFVHSIMTDIPFEYTYSIADGKIKVTFQTKTAEMVNKGWEWINKRIENAKTTNEYLQLVSQADLAGYLKSIKCNGDINIDDNFENCDFEERIKKLDKFTAPKLAIFYELMLDFIGTIEALRLSVLSSDF